MAKLVGCHVYDSSNQSISDSTTTAITFDSERSDSDTMHSTSTNTNRITIQTAGHYMFGCNISWSTNSTGVRFVGIRLNGSTYLSSDKRDAAGSGQTDQVLVMEYDFSASDYIEVMVQQTSGGALNLLASGNYSPEFWARRVG